MVVGVVDRYEMSGRSERSNHRISDDEVNWNEDEG